MKPTKKTLTKSAVTVKDDSMRPEYDLSKGTRGKHYKSRQNGYTVKIHNEDGTAVIRKVTAKTVRIN